MMRITTLFEKQVFVRLTDDQTDFICTVKWPFLSKVRRVAVTAPGSGLAPQATESGWISGKELPVLRRIRPG